MMSIVRQQLLLFILFIIVMLAKMLIIGGVIHNAYELADSTKWIAHSNEVSESIRAAKQSFTDADLRGRLELVGLSSGSPKQQLRDASLKNIALVRNLVADNPAQTANVEELRAAIETRFKAQDAAAGASQRSEGVLTLSVEQNTNSIEALHRVESAFNNIEAQEHSLLRFRHVGFNAQQTRFNNLFIALMVLSTTTLSSLTFFAWRTLKHTRRSSLQLANEVVPMLDNSKRKRVIEIIKILDEGAFEQGG